jgi:hypothetical protein
VADEPKKGEPTREQILVAKLLGDKTPTGAEVRKIARELFPDAPVPAEDAETVVAPVKTEVADVKAILTKLAERLDAKDKADADLKAENDMSVKIAAARQKYGLMDSGVEKMITRMKETGNYSDAEAAAAWVVSQLPKPEPVSTPSWLPQESNLFGSQKKDEAFEALHKDPRKYMDDQLRDFVRDPDKYVRETFGTA